MGKRVSRFDGIGWADYVRARGLTFPPGATWADFTSAESRRLNRNYERWRARRVARQREPLRFVLRGDTVVVEDEA